MEPNETTQTPTEKIENAEMNRLAAMDTATQFIIDHMKSQGFTVGEATAVAQDVIVTMSGMLRDKKLTDL